MIASLKNGKVALIGASFCAVLATLFVYFHLANARRDPREGTSASVLIASRDLASGVVIQRDMIEVAEVPATQSPRDALGTTMQVVGQVTARAIPAGAVLTPKLIVEPSAALGPSYVLPRNMRAVTVSVDGVSGIANLLKPGDRVDVVGTFERGNEKKARAVLQDIEVLAVGTALEREEAAKPAPSRAGMGTRERRVPITMAVTVPDAERLILADESGDIRLALRPAAGGDYARTRGVTETQVSGLRLPQRGSQRTAAVRAGRDRADRIRAIRGDNPQVSVAPVPALPDASPRRRGHRAAASEVTPAPGDGSEYEVTIVRGNRVETVTVRGPEPEADSNQASAKKNAQSTSLAPQKDPLDEKAENTHEKK
jgi:pilus assembly protein CpaB